MSLPRRRLSLAGCRTHAEAIARYEAWFREHLSDLERQNETDRLLDVEAEHLDIDASDAARDFEVRSQSAALEEAVNNFREFLKREFPE